MAEVQSTTVPPVEYRDIPGFDGYRVGSDGSVYSRRACGPWGHKYRGTFRRLKPKPDRGYLIATLSLDSGRRAYRQVGNLVLLAFVGPPPTPKHQCCHDDGDRRNNAAGNLRWGTAKENNRDKLRHGTIAHGDRHGNAKLSAKDVPGIIRAHRAGDTTYVIAARLRVHPSTVQRVLIGRTWRHLTGIRKGENQ